MRSIFDRAFHYTSSVETDLKKTFARERRRLKDEAEAKVRDEEARLAQAAAEEAERAAKVRPMKKSNQSKG